MFNRFLKKHPVLEIIVNFSMLAICLWVSHLLVSVLKVTRVEGHYLFPMFQCAFLLFALYANVTTGKEEESFLERLRNFAQVGTVIAIGFFLIHSTVGIRSVQRGHYTPPWWTLSPSQWDP